MNIVLSQVNRESFSSGHIPSRLGHPDDGVIELDNISDV
jgi:hypothetical protein